MRKTSYRHESLFSDSIPRYRACRISIIEKRSLVKTSFSRIMKSLDLLGIGKTVFDLSLENARTPTG
jgi:hypothetical protein